MQRNSVRWRIALLLLGAGWILFALEHTGWFGGDEEADDGRPLSSGKGVRPPASSYPIAPPASPSPASPNGVPYLEGSERFSSDGRQVPLAGEQQVVLPYWTRTDRFAAQPPTRAPAAYTQERDWNRPPPEGLIPPAGRPAEVPGYRDRGVSPYAPPSVVDGGRRADGHPRGSDRLTPFAPGARWQSPPAVNGVAPPGWASNEVYYPGISDLGFPVPHDLHSRYEGYGGSMSAPALEFRPQPPRRQWGPPPGEYGYGRSDQPTTRDYPLGPEQAPPSRDATRYSSRGTEPWNPWAPTRSWQDAR